MFGGLEFDCLDWSLGLNLRFGFGLVRFWGVLILGFCFWIGVFAFVFGLF